MHEPPGLLIGAVRRSLKQVVTERVLAHGLTPQQFWVLNAVFECDGLSLRELAEGRHMDQPTASRVVATLTRRMLVHMREDPSDRRRTRLSLTAKGRSLAKRVHPVALEIRQVVEAGLSVSERRALQALLLKVLMNVNRLRDGLPRARRKGA